MTSNTFLYSSIITAGLQIVLSFVGWVDDVDLSLSGWFDPKDVDDEDVVCLLIFCFWWRHLHLHLGSPDKSTSNSWMQHFLLADEQLVTVSFLSSVEISSRAVQQSRQDVMLPTQRSHFRYSSSYASVTSIFPFGRRVRRREMCAGLINRSINKTRSLICCCTVDWKSSLIDELLTGSRITGCWKETVHASPTSLLQIRCQLPLHRRKQKKPEWPPIDTRFEWVMGDDKRSVSTGRLYKNSH